MPQQDFDPSSDKNSIFSSLESPNSTSRAKLEIQLRQALIEELATAICDQLGKPEVQAHALLYSRERKIIALRNLYAAEIAQGEPNPEIEFEKEIDQQIEAEKAQLQNPSTRKEIALSSAAQVINSDISVPNQFDALLELVSENEELTDCIPALLKLRGLTLDLFLPRKLYLSALLDFAEVHGVEFAASSEGQREVMTNLYGGKDGYRAMLTELQSREEKFTQAANTILTLPDSSNAEVIAICNGMKDMLAFESKSRAAFSKILGIDLIPWQVQKYFPE